ncbi:MAG: glycosyltransferase family 39 protein [Bacteroidales bacterium]|nr:glycosyltransferase family 39 protein [Bacteroidales bacterium]
MKIRLIVILSLLLLIIALTFHLNAIGLRAEEPKRAILGIETYTTGNFIVPQIHGYPYFDKPPFYNWILALFYGFTKSFDEWVVRLPGILSIILTALFTFLIAKKYTTCETAYFSAMAYITSADLFFYGSVNAGEIDLFYSLVVFLQVISIFWYFERRKYLPLFLGSYLFMTVGFLTKGLPSLAFQSITLIAIAWYFKSWRFLFSWRHLAGITLFLIVAGGYFYIYSKSNDALAYLVSISKQSSQRSFNEYSILPVLKQIVVFPVQMFKLLLPWSLLIIFLLRTNIRSTVRSNKLVEFSILFVIGNIIIYWLSPEVRDRYLYMFLPFLSIILIYFFQQFRKLEPLKEKWIRWIFGGIMFLILLFFIGFQFIPELTRNLTSPILISILISFGLGSIIFLFFRLKQEFIYLFILFIIVTRIGFNIVVLPYLHQHSRASEYIEHVERIIAISKDAPVYYTGYPLTYYPDISLAGNPIYQAEITIPPLTAFQIPYYLFKSNHKIALYEPEPESGKFYLSYEPFSRNFDIDIYYSFDERLINQKMLLFKLK